MFPLIFLKIASIFIFIALHYHHIFLRVASIYIIFAYQCNILVLSRLSGLMC